MATRLNRCLTGGYVSPDDRFWVYRHEENGRWYLVDYSWNRSPCNDFGTLQGARDFIAETLGRPNQGRP